MKNRVLTYFAAICFAAIAILDIAELYNNLLTYRSHELLYSIDRILEIIASILIFLSLLTSTPILSIVGLELKAILQLVSICSDTGFFWEYRYTFGYLYPFGEIYPMILQLVVYILLMLTAINPKFAKAFGIAPIIICVVTVAIHVTKLIMYLNTTIFFDIFRAAGIIPFGLTYVKFSKKESIRKVATMKSTNASAQEAFEESTVERLVRLKSFLDDNVITQDEFDSKKKQLLNQ